MCTVLVFAFHIFLTIIANVHKLSFETFTFIPFKNDLLYKSGFIFLYLFLYIIERNMCFYVERIPSVFIPVFPFLFLKYIVIQIFIHLIFFTDPTLI